MKEHKEVFKKVLHVILLVLLVGISGAIGYSVYEPIRHTAPAVTQISSTCEVADGIGYRMIIQNIVISDAAGLYIEIRDLKRMGVKEVRFYINSPGGSLFDSFAIYDAIKRISEEGITTVAHIEGWCLSAAVIVAAACDYRIAAPNCRFMVHNPIGADDRTKDVINQYARLMEENSDLTAEEWKEKMNAQTWFTPEEALEWGLIDEIK